MLPNLLNLINTKLLVGRRWTWNIVLLNVKFIEYHV